MASKKLSSDTSLANSYKLSRGVASVARPSAPTIGTATDGGSGLMSVTFTASTLGPTASSFTLTSSSGVTGSGASSPLTLQETAVGTYTYSVSGVNANGTGPSSAASNSVNVASVFAPSGAYDSIATSTVGSGGTASVTFSSIPSTYTHLQIRWLAQCTNSGQAPENMGFRFNSDTGANYTRHYIDTDGTTVTAGANTGLSQAYSVLAQTSSTYPSAFSTGYMDILDYANTNKYTTTRSLAGIEYNGSGSNIQFTSDLWLNTAAVTTINIRPLSGSFKEYSSFALYGIKGN